MRLKLSNSSSQERLAQIKRVRQLAIVGGIGDVEAARQHCDSAPASIERGGMSDSIDAQREAAHDGNVSPCQIRDYALRDLLSVGARIARANDCQREAVGPGKFAVQVQNWW